MVKERNPIMVILYSFCTCGFYSLYWFIQTKNEMNEKGADIPTAWWLIIPILNIFWLYKYCLGWEKVTKAETSGMMIFIISLIFSPAAMYMVQTELNKLAK